MSEPKPIPPINPNVVTIDPAEIGFTLACDGADDAGVDGSVDGWIYVGFPEGGVDRCWDDRRRGAGRDVMAWIGRRIEAAIGTVFQTGLF